MSISRRTALATGAAAITTAAVTAPLALKATATKAALAGEEAQASDTVLLARIERFHDVYGEWQDVWEKQQVHRAEIEARPDCPARDPATRSRAHEAFLEANDAFRYCDQSERLGNQAGALTNAIFETPAQTARGVLEKVRILYIARGKYNEDGDDDLEGYQDDENSPWFGHVIADLERLSGGLPL